jgi:oligopeptide transport system permease protein
MNMSPENQPNLTPELFSHVGKNLQEAEALRRPSITYWRDAWRRFRKNKVALVALIILILMGAMAIFGPYTTKWKYQEQETNYVNNSPSARHWFGTDELGRDLYVRSWYGARISLSIGLVAALVNVILGVIYGGISGYYGGRVDNLMMRVVDVLFGVPYLMVVIMLRLVLGGNMFTLILAMCLMGWIGMARLVRGQILQLKQMEFVLAARTLGAGPSRIIARHLIPNTMGPILVALTGAIPGAIFAEAFLSYIGLGIQPPMASWGSLASTATQNFLFYPYQLVPPSVLISLTMLSFNLMGDAMRDALDPRLRQ